MINKLVFLAAGAAAAIFAAPIVARAETPASAADPAQSALGEVVVTARRQAESAQKIPVAITVVSGQLMENNNVRRLEDLTKFTPGLVIAPASSSPITSVISIRGQAQADNLGTVDGSTGIYYDGVYIPRAPGLRYILGDSEQIGQIEVLRGPQGTLFGRNTTGGALNITSRAPGQTLGGYVKVIGGSFGLFNISAGVNAPITADAGLRLALATRNTPEERGE